MPSLTLRPSHKAVLAYYESLEAFRTLGATHELAVKTAFATLLEVAAKPFGWKLVPEHSMRAKGGKRIQPDGTLIMQPEHISGAALKHKYGSAACNDATCVEEACV